MDSLPIFPNTPHIPSNASHAVSGEGERNKLLSQTGGAPSLREAQRTTPEGRTQYKHIQPLDKKAWDSLCSAAGIFGSAGRCCINNH